MNTFTHEETEILKVVIKEFANKTSNFGHPRSAEFELNKDEEMTLNSLINKFDVNLDDEEII
jgi:hypothetical protein